MSVVSAAPPEVGRHPVAGTARRISVLTVIGLLAVVALVADVILGLWVTPPDEHMGNLVRLLYIHPPIAMTMFIAYGVTFLASLGYLWPRTRSLALDRLAGASAEVGVVFTALTLVTGSIWGRPTWGAWWVWDPLLTTTALLFVLYLGYLAIRQVPGTPEQRARRSAIAAMIAFVDVPVVYYSVQWWNSLHQQPSLVPGKTYIHGSMLYTLLLGFVAFILVFVFLVGHRYRLGALADEEAGEGLARELEARRQEGL